MTLDFSQEQERLRHGTKQGFVSFIIFYLFSEFLAYSLRLCSLRSPSVCLFDYFAWRRCITQTHYPERKRGVFIIITEGWGGVFKFRCPSWPHPRPRTLDGICSAVSDAWQRLHVYFAKKRWRCYFRSLTTCSTVYISDSWVLDTVMVKLTLTNIGVLMCTIKTIFCSNINALTLVRQLASSKLKNMWSVVETSYKKKLICLKWKAADACTHISEKKIAWILYIFGKQKKAHNWYQFSFPQHQKDANHTMKQNLYGEYSSILTTRKNK